MVSLIHFMLRMGQMVCQFPIVGHNQSTAGIIIQTANRKQTGINILHHIHNRQTVLIVIHGGHHTQRLIDQHIFQLFLRFNEAAVYHYLVAFLHIISRLLHYGAVDLHIAVGNEFIGLSAAGYTCLCDIFINSHLL